MIRRAVRYTLATLLAQEVARRAGLEAEVVEQRIVVDGRMGYRLGLSAHVV